MTKLILVYNANGGIANGFIDLLNKNTSPKTYPCSLCSITYNNLGMVKTWKEYISNLPFESIFKHKNEYSGNEELPVILLVKNAKEKVLLSAKELSIIENSDALIIELKNKFKNLNV